MLMGIAIESKLTMISFLLANLNCPVMNYHRDGLMRVDENGGGRVILRTEQFQWSSATRAL
jgi:hypothetical protein